jgi:mono/diheme cytochrome c family protein
MTVSLLLPLMIACSGGEEKKEAAPPAPTTPPAAAPAPTPPAPAPEAAAPAAPAGPYAPDDMAKAAYEKAKAAGADAKTNAKKGDAAAIAAGKGHYDMRCASCHGATGMGDGIAGQALPQKPANFHDKDRWAFTSDGVKHWVIMNGVQGTAMAPLGLTEDQAWEVLAYIQSEFVK